MTPMTLGQQVQNICFGKLCYAKVAQIQDVYNVLLESSGKGIYIHDIYIIYIRILYLLYI